MGGWSDLNQDLLRAIARRLTVAVDRVQFGAVCKWWQFVAKTEHNYLPPPPPWLMLSENPTECSTRGFIGLSANDKDDEEEKVFQISFPEGRGNRCVGSTGTWVITVDENCVVNLLNPLTRDHIDLPPLSTFGRIYDEVYSYGEELATKLNFRDYFIEKAFLRWLPTHNQQQEQDFIVIAMYHSCRLLAFTRRCSNSWTTIEMDTQPFFRDVIFYNAKSKFYGVTFKGFVMEIDIDGEPEPKTIQIFDSFIRDKYDYCPSYYLVECSGQLLQVIKLVYNSFDVDNPVYYTLKFEVYALDFTTGERTELKSLGRHSLFLGANTSVALLADEDGSFNGNCIYFTDDHRQGYRGLEVEGGKDMGVFDLESGSIKPHCKPVSLSYFSPPLWLIPSNFTR